MAGGPKTTALVVMGPSGTGKTTVAELLGERLGWATFEADEFHQPANIDKMTRGIPLTDEDRWPWLRSIRDHLSEQEDKEQNSVVTCSALKRVYRDVLRETSAKVIFIELTGPIDLIAERMEGRSGHFMPKSLLQSQFDTLEELAPEEAGVKADVSNTPDEIVAKVLKELNLDSQASAGGP
ncbi:gluconokinase [Arthrobacter monumenti]